MYVGFSLKLLRSRIKVQTIGELRMRGTANDGLGYCRLLVISR